MEKIDELMGKQQSEFSGIESPDEGLKWSMPQCVKCLHNLGKECDVYKCHRLLAPVNIYDCPSFEEEDKIKAGKLFGV